MDCDRIQLGRWGERERGFRVIAIVITAHLRPTYTPTELRPVLPTACESDPPLLPSITVLYKISIDSAPPPPPPSRPILVI